MSPARSLRLLLVLALVPAIALATLPAPHAHATLPSRFTKTVVFSGLTAPTAVRFSPDGRVFVAEKSGVVKVFDSLSDTTPHVFLDLRAEVEDFWDRGLLGLALAPNFPTDPSVYVLYTYDAPIGGQAPTWGKNTPNNDPDPCPSPPGATLNGCVVSGRVSRFIADGDSAGAEQVLVEGWCQQFPSHSMGSLQFGADGALYASAGDGASFTTMDYGQFGSPLNPCGDPPGGAGAVLTPPTAEGGSLRAQDLRTPGDPVGLNGSLIRIDPLTGQGLPDNPYYSSTDPNARRIVAYGLRNPFRFTVRPGTNDVWIGDVGNNAWEEIDHLPNTPAATPTDFGWPCYEGVNPQAAYKNLGTNICKSLYAAGPSAVSAPYFTYQHGTKVADETCPSGSSSISGLAFHQPGGSYPSQYDNALFFADYSRQCVWVMYPGADGLPDPSTRTVFDDAAGGVIDVENGPGGDLFYVDLLANQIVRVTYRAANSAPDPVLTATPTQGHHDLLVKFSAAGTTDIDDDPITYAWDLDGNGVYDDSTDVAPQHTYYVDGDVTVGLQVSDDHGNTKTTSVVIHVGNVAPTPTIATPLANLAWSVGDQVSFSGSATDFEDGPLPASSLLWELVMEHCYTPTNCHEHFLLTWNGVDHGSFVAPDHPYPSYLQLRLTATDSKGLQTTIIRRIYPRTVTISVTSAVPGVGVGLGDDVTLTPFQKIVIAGSANTISAPPSAVVGGTTYAFAGWSDGSPSVHSVITTTDTTLTVLLANLAAAGGSSPAQRLRCDVQAAQVLCVHASGPSGPARATPESTASALAVASTSDSLLRLADAEVDVCDIQLHHAAAPPHD